MMDTLTSLRGVIDRAQFDLDALSLQLAFADPSEILGWMRDHIAFEPYIGLLRGAEGTLMSGAGNSLDQAALLAHLLKDAGFEARVASGRLSSSQARELVQQTRKRDPEPGPFVDKKAATEILDRLATSGAEPNGDAASMIASVLDPPSVETAPLFAAAERDAGGLQQRLETIGLDVGTDGNLDAIVAESRDYFWVQYRSQGGGWNSLHPAFRQRPTWADEVEVAEVLNDSVPARLQHRFRLQAFVDQRVAGKVTSHPIMDAWERPAANLSGRSIGFQIYPDGISDPSDMADVGRVYEETNFYIPLLDGRLAPGGQFFDAMGNVVPPDAASSPYAGVFQTVANKLSQATSALGNLSTPPGTATPPAVALSGVRLQYTLIAPGGQERSFVRYIWGPQDAAGPENASAAGTAGLDAGSGLASTHNFLLATGSLPKAYTLDLAVARLLALRPMLRSAIDRQYGRGDATPLTENELAAIDTQDLGLLSLLVAFDEAPRAVSEILYRAEPTLVVKNQSLWYWHLDGTSIDIVNNHRRAFTADMKAPAPEAAIFAGVWESRVEDRASTSGDRVTTVHVMQRARQAGIPILVLPPDPKGIARAQGMNLAPPAMANLVADLTSGFAVVIPQTVPPGTDHTAWWRVNPTSGETLGIIDTGLGGDLTEETVSILAVSTMLVAAIACGTLASLDEEGLTLRDVEVCNFSAGAAGEGMLAAGAAGMGLAAAALPILAASFLLVAIATGIWLNSSPVLDQPAF